MLSELEKERYTRHFLLNDFSLQDQLKLKAARVLVIGAGGLGSPVLLYLAAAGIGKLGIVDYDAVQLSNLHRQILYNTSEIGQKKAEVAGNKLSALNPETNIELFDLEWNSQTAPAIAENYTVLIDCTDTIKSRLVTSSVSESLKIPFVYGAINGWELQVSVFGLKGNKSYEEVFGSANSANTPGKPLGVIGPAPAVAGSLMASETVKIVLSKGNLLSGKLLYMNLLSNHIEVFDI